MKKQSLKKLLALLLCLLVFAAVLSGCGKHVCDYCGDTFTGKVYKSVYGDAELCKDCAEIENALYSAFSFD